ncbi:hypothetical protein Vafri_8424 [Volvox africanus]|nr:hypothetical protein Vafri_8424 [Volvox africanus]
MICAVWHLRPPHLWCPSCGSFCQHSRVGRHRPQSYAKWDLCFPAMSVSSSLTLGAELVEGLEVRKGELVLVKKRFSAFLHTHLDLVLRRLRVRRVVLCGVQTPNCIRATAVDSLGHDYETLVLSDATGSKSEAVQGANLEDMRCMGIATPTVAEWAAGM